MLRNDSGSMNDNRIIQLYVFTLIMLVVLFMIALISADHATPQENIANHAYHMISVGLGVYK